MPTLELPATTDERLPSALWVLSGAYFVQATGALSVIGAMDAIASTWAVTRQEVALLITAFGVPFALMAPLLQISGVGRWARRQQLLLGMGAFGVFSAMAALSQSYEQLLLARIGMGISAALMGPVLGALGSSLVPPRQQGQALARVLMGLSVAAVAGAPMAAWIATAWGPRWLFGGVAVLVGLNLAAVIRLVPRGLPVAGSDWRVLVQFVSRPRPLAAFLVASFAAAGVFTFQSFLEPVVKHHDPTRPGSVTQALLTLGLAGVAGNAFVGWASRRHAADRLLLGAFAVLLSVLGLLTLTVGSLPGLYVLLVVWALATDVVWPTQQRRVVEFWPEHRGLALALTASFMFCGMGVGAAAGSMAYANAGLVGLVAASTAWLLLAAVMVRVTRRASTR